MGAVLGWTGLTQGLVDDGRLVPLVPQRVEMPEHFYIKLRPYASKRARLVYDWLRVAAH